MKEIKTFQNDAFKDHRGYYWTSWHKKSFRNLIFNHDKFSISKYRVLRGFHGDKKTWKLVSCVYGEVFFVIINYDKKSLNYLKWKKFSLSHKNRLQILVPPNFLNGFQCLSQECVFHYKLSYKGKYNDVKNQISIKWNDPRFNIQWPINHPILSKRDR